MAYIHLLSLQRFNILEVESLLSLSELGHLKRANKSFSVIAKLVGAYRGRQLHGGRVVSERNKRGETEAFSYVL